MITRISLCFFVVMLIAVRSPAQDIKFDTPDAVVQKLYDVISGPAGERDWNTFHALFTPEATMGAVYKDQKGTVQYVSFTPVEYQERNGPAFRERGFFEEELHREVHAFGELVHVFTTYQFRFEKDGPVIQRGINSVQLVYADDGWKVASIRWNSERPDNPIPPEYLPR